MCTPVRVRIRVLDSDLVPARASVRVSVTRAATDAARAPWRVPSTSACVIAENDAPFRTRRFQRDATESDPTPRRADHRRRAQSVRAFVLPMCFRRAFDKRPPPAPR